MDVYYTNTGVAGNPGQELRLILKRNFTSVNKTLLHKQTDKKKKKLDGVAMLVADPPRWNSSSRQNPPNQQKLP